MNRDKFEKQKIDYEKNGGLDLLERIQDESKNEDVYNLAGEIVDAFFSSYQQQESQILYN